MCNEKNKTKNREEQRFIDYRLTQLEINLNKSLAKLEQERKQEYNLIQDSLKTLQEGINSQSRTLIELEQKEKALEEKLVCIDKLKEAATKNTTRVHNIERRLDIYKQVLIVVAGGVVVALLTELIRMI